MRPGRRWLVLDADFYANPFTQQLVTRFGLAGASVFVAYLCACKRSNPQGQITYSSDIEAVTFMGVHHCPLVDNEGRPWTLDDLWKFTGQFKQTKKTARGQLKNVKATNWSQWQETLKRERDAERQRRSRSLNGRDIGVTDKRHKSDTKATDKDIDIDIPPYPPRGAEVSFAQNVNGNVDCVDLNQAIDELKATLRGDQ